MKVKELIEELQKFDENYNVILVSDDDSLPIEYKIENIDTDKENYKNLQIRLGSYFKANF